MSFYNHEEGDVNEDLLKEYTDSLDFDDDDFYFEEDTEKKSDKKNKKKKKK